MALVDVCVQDVSAADEGAAHEPRANRALDRAAESVAVTNDVDLASLEATRDLAHSPATGEMVFAHAATAHRVRLHYAATDHLPVIVADRMLARVESFPAHGGMHTLAARRMSAVAL